MADFAIASTSAEQIRGTLNPVDKDGKASVPDGPIMVTKESGAGDYAQVAERPLEIVYKSAAAADVSVFVVTGHSLNGPDISDRVTCTTTLFVPPTPPMTSLGQSFSAPEPKA